MAKDVMQSQIVRTARRKGRSGGPMAMAAQGFMQGMNQGLQMGLSRAMTQQKSDQSAADKFANFLSTQAKSLEDNDRRADVMNLAMAVKMRDVTPSEAGEYILLNKIFSGSALEEPEEVTPVSTEPPKPEYITKAEWQQKMAKQMEPQRKQYEREYGRLAAKKRGQTSFVFEGVEMPISLGEWTEEDQKNLEFYAEQLREFGIATPEVPNTIAEIDPEIDEILEGLEEKRKVPAQVVAPARSKPRTTVPGPSAPFQQSGMMSPGGMRRAGRKPVG